MRDTQTTTTVAVLFVIFIVINFKFEHIFKLFLFNLAGDTGFEPVMLQSKCSVLPITPIPYIPKIALAPRTLECFGKNAFKNSI